MQRGYHFLLFLVNYAMICEIIFSHVIVLLTENSKTVLSLLQVSFFGENADRQKKKKKKNLKKKNSEIC